MNRHQRHKLEQRLAELSKRERDELFQEARRRRGEAQKRRRAKARESVDGERVGSRRRADPLHDWVLRLLAERLKGADARRDAHDDGRLHAGTVVGLTRRSAVVRPDDRAEPVECRLSADLAGRQQSDIAIGDAVVFVERADAGAGAPREVIRVLPRRTFLSRPDPGDPRVERVGAANIDAVVIVVSVRSPPLHPRLIDRYLVAIQRGGAEPIVAVNKADLLDDASLAAELERLEPYRRAGVPVVVCRAAPEGAGAADVDELRARLAGKACAFVGHSGVGKSSIANALDPALDLETSAVGSAANRGRHTTTASSMHEIAGGIRVIDTPGVRFFGLHAVTPDELARAFPEFVPLAAACKFRDCTHTHEPGCAVKAAVEGAGVNRQRYDTYLRLLAEVRGETDPDSGRIRPAPDDEPRSG